MELPTYTNIWRIEKRLYKLYDFRLPMPLPVGQIAVFAAITVPYVVILKVLGLPFSHTLLWLYILPPGVLAWLITRPVLEGKRLPELVHSQVRYLSEPRTWCRMAPFAEQDETVVAARVWRQARREIATVSVPAVPTSEVTVTEVAVAAAPELAPAAESAPERAVPARHWPEVPIAAWPGELAPGVREVARPDQARAVSVPPVSEAPDQAARAVPGRPVPEVPGPDHARAVAAPAVPQASPPRPRPVVTVTGDQDAERPLRAVERALGNPAERRAAGWHDHVVVVPGGHRPGQPDQLQRDRSRVRLKIQGCHRIVVLGCTVGAGQTMTTLLTGEVLASLRDEQIAVLDLNPGTGSLAQRARAVPALTGSGPPAPSRLEVITREAAAGPGPGADQQDVTRVFELLSARYPLTFADPSAAAVPRVLAAADQLLLVAPASQDAASALATTREWLEAHGHAGLADTAITVLNGVSRHTLPHVEQAEALVRGQCRAIVRIPWDDYLKRPGPERIPARVPAAPPRRPAAGSLSPAALHAYTALAGVLVAALGTAPEQLQRARP